MKLDTLKIIETLKKYKYIVAAIAAVLFLILYTRFINASAKDRCEKAKSDINTQFIYELDSLKRNNYELLTRTFAWALRAEIVRDNYEQADQLLLAFIKTKQVNTVDLIDVQDGTIRKSSNKKREGLKLDDPRFANLQKIVSSSDSSSFTYICPIMGVDQIIAILQVEYLKS